ncbi:MAG TPA: hypothetical protein VM425_13990 [Myxococcota bacterium]|nr:hypothetical protein [Myxococcota bacterium]
MKLGAQNKTASFLGDEREWKGSRIEMVDVDGRDGGVRIRIEGTGLGTVEPVKWKTNPIDERSGLYTTTFPFSLPEADITNLLTLFVEMDFLTITVPKDHKPVRSETIPGITLSSYLGVSHTVEKYASQKVDRFDSISGILNGLETKLVPLRDDSKWEEEGWRPWAGFSE